MLRYVFYQQRTISIGSKPSGQAAYILLVLLLLLTDNMDTTALPSQVLGVLSRLTNYSLREADYLDSWRDAE